MPLHRFYRNPIVEPTTELAGPETHHLISVLRLQTGDKVELFDGAGGIAVASIAAIKKRKVALQIEKVEHYAARRSGRIIIAVSIAKGARFDWLIEKCTELGVDRICPVVFARTVRLPKNPKTRERWRAIAIESATQCRRLFLPRIDAPAPLAGVIEALKKDYPNGRFVFGSPSPLSSALTAAALGAADVIAFVGPEGGLTDDEIRLLIKSGAVPVRLAETILRIETAAIAFASILSALRSAVQPPANPETH